VAAASIVLTFAGGASVVTAARSGSLDDGEQTIQGDALPRASKAALAATGGGRVTGTEVGDEDSYYEVEVTLDNGRQVDVQLDEAFHLVSHLADVENSGEAGN
jgi:hypothetical protein